MAVFLAFFPPASGEAAGLMRRTCCYSCQKAHSTDTPHQDTTDPRVAADYEDQQRTGVQWNFLQSNFFRISFTFSRWTPSNGKFSFRVAGQDVLFCSRIYCNIQKSRPKRV